MEYIGPFSFNGIRFALGSLSLLPLVFFREKKTRPVESLIPQFQGIHVLKWGFIAGILIFMGVSFQQWGMVYTTAGKAGFITGLYVILVPLLGLFWGHRTRFYSWLAAGIACIGLYFLSINESFQLSWGDLLEIIGAFFWAGHVLLIGWLTMRMDSIKLSCIQFAGCSILSLIAALLFETITMAGVMGALIPILYGGLISTGIAYTLQVVAQKDAPPSHASIIMSLEAVFAALGGWIVLHEILSMRSVLGCSLMLFGILLSQLQFFIKKK